MKPARSYTARSRLGSSRHVLGSRPAPETVRRRVARLLVLGVLGLSLEACGASAHVPQPPVSTGAVPGEAAEPYSLPTQEVAGLEVLTVPSALGGTHVHAALWFDAGGADAAHPVSAALAAWSLSPTARGVAYPFGLALSADAPQLDDALAPVLAALADEALPDVPRARLEEARRAARAEPTRDAIRRALIGLLGPSVDLLGAPGDDAGTEPDDVAHFVADHLGVERALLVIAGDPAQLVPAAVAAAVRQHLPARLRRARELSSPWQPTTSRGVPSGARADAARAVDFPIPVAIHALARAVDSVDRRTHFPAPRATNVTIFPTPAGDILVAAGPSPQELRAMIAGLPSAEAPSDLAGQLRTLGLRWLSTRRRSPALDDRVVQSCSGPCAEGASHEGNERDLDGIVHFLPSALPTTQVGVRFSGSALEARPGLAGGRALTAIALAQLCEGEAHVDADGWELRARRADPHDALAFVRCVLAAPPRMTSGLRESLAAQVPTTRNWPHGLVDPHHAALLGATRRGLLQSEPAEIVTRDRTRARTRVVIAGPLDEAAARRALAPTLAAMDGGRPAPPQSTLTIPPSEPGEVQPEAALDGQPEDIVHVGALYSSPSPSDPRAVEALARALTRHLLARGVSVQRQVSDGGAWGGLLWVELQLHRSREAELGDLLALGPALANVEVPTPDPIGAVLRGLGTPTPLDADAWSALPHLYVGRAQERSRLRRARRRRRSARRRRRR